MHRQRGDILILQKSSHLFYIRLGIAEYKVQSASAVFKSVQETIQTFVMNHRAPILLDFGRGVLLGHGNMNRVVLDLIAELGKPRWLGR